MDWFKNLGGKRPKYGNKRVEYNGEKFDSKRELNRYLYLLQAQREGKISNLERQVRFELLPPVLEEYEVQLKTKTVTKTRTKQRAVTYACDFRYVKDNETIVEDVKSSPSQTTQDKGYVLRKKMMLALKGIEVKEVYKSNDEI